MPVAINLDGIERKRAKWNAVGRAWYAFGELCSVLFGSKLIADAEMIAEYYAQVYRAKTSIIRYGCIAVSPEEIASKLEHASGFELRQSALLGEGCSIFSELPVFSESAVAPGGYFLYVSRLEPENNAHRVIASYNALPTEIKLKFPLLIVGDAPYAKDYITGLHREAGEGIHFLGYRFGEQYRALQLGAYAYIQATEVGGTHPALVEAMGFGNCVLANTTPEHSEALANAGLYYAKNNLAELTSLMRSVAGNPELVLEKRKAAYQRAQKEFSWERITNDYEELLTGLLS